MTLKGKLSSRVSLWVATANAVVNAGAIPVFADVDYETRNLTSQNIKKPN